MLRAKGLTNLQNSRGSDIKVSKKKYDSALPFLFLTVFLMDLKWVLDTMLRNE
jgi:hypothetical protein